MRRDPTPAVEVHSAAANFGAYLDRMAARLSVGDAINYAAFFLVVAVPGAGEYSLGDIMKVAISDNVVVGGSTPGTVENVLEAMRSSLDYRGDSSSHPNLYYLDSPDFAADQRGVLDAAIKLLANADLVWDVHIKDGHPFYPVYWDFAFVVVQNGDAIVLVGASSD